MRLGKVSAILWTVCAAILIAGCHSEQPSSASSSATPQKAVLVQTGNGGSAVYIPSTEAPGGVERLAGDKEAPVCKQCQEDIAAYFSGGSLAPKCSVCGAIRTPLHATN